MTASGKTPTGNLPAELTSFVGRQVELLDVRQALEAARLLTLVGPGGVGKTRLGLRAAAAARRAFRDGVWLVDIAPLRDGELVATTIAATLGLQNRTARWPPGVLGDQLADRAMLLVLDNCEHLSEACAVVVQALLTRCPELRVLATSRQPLDIPGEHLIAINPLRAPSYDDRVVAPAELARYDAVTLFVDRARALEPRFALNPENAAAVAELCYRLDGLPLAVELAAARVRHLSPQQILARLEPGYDLLTVRGPATPPRQRSLRSLVQWSHDLCDTAERTLWARLTVFSGSFSAESAEAVCAGGELPREAVLPTLTSLVDKSIVATEPGGPDVRYRMLEVIRAFGYEQLVAADEQDTVRRAHRDHYWRTASADNRRWFGPDQLQLLRWCRLERDNLRAAVDFSLQDTDGLPGAAVIATALAGAAIVSGLHAEGRHWMDKVLRVPGPPGRERVMLMWVNGSCAQQQGDLDGAEPLLEEAVELGTRLGDRHETAMALAFLGRCRLQRGRLAESIDVLEQALSFDEGGTDPMMRANVTADLAAAEGRRGDLDRAVAWCRESIAVSEASSDRWHKAQALGQLGDLLRRRGAHADAADVTCQALELQLLFNHAVGTAQSFDTLAAIAAMDGDLLRAARLLGSADALRRGTDLQRLDQSVEHRDEVLARARQALGAAAFAEAHARGLRAPVEDNAAFARGAEPEPELAPEPATSTDPGLTRREREIAELIATGASNKEIASTLVISPRTAEGHVVHILDKLGFSSRVQIAAWMSEQASAR